VDAGWWGHLRCPGPFINHHPIVGGIKKGVRVDKEEALRMTNERFGVDKVLMGDYL